MITMSEQGKTLLITRTKGGNRTAKIKKIDKDHYEDLRTGEIKKFNHKAKSRKDNIKALYHTFARLRAIVNTNTEHPDHVLWVTFTYEKNMTDADRLRRDFSNFWGRFKTYCKRNDISRPEYIVVAEPQMRGAWHLHALLIFPHRRPYIENEQMREIWRQGFTWTKALKNNDNVAGYLCAYLTDLPISDISGDDRNKAIIKGARMYLYPPGFHLFRCSRGIKRPIKTEITYEEMQMIDDECEFKGKREIEFKDHQTGYETKVVKKWYRIPDGWQEDIKPKRRRRIRIDGLYHLPNRKMKVVSRRKYGNDSSPEESNEKECPASV